MKITQLRIDYLENPMGFEFEKPVITYQVTETNAKVQTAVQIEVALNIEFNNLCYDTGKNSLIKENKVQLEMTLACRTRYYYRVTVWNEKNECAVSDIEWFETGKRDEPWQAAWIAPLKKPVNHPVFIKEFYCSKKVLSVRLYISGLGIYEAYFNDRKAGDEYLSPGYHDYDSWIQYQTYDITELLRMGKNIFTIYMGNGWYKGRLGFGGGKEDSYGSEFMVIAELHLEYEDGTKEIIATDSDFKVMEGPVSQSGIYYGEDYDGTWCPGAQSIICRYIHSLKSM